MVRVVALQCVVVSAARRHVLILQVVVVPVIGRQIVVEQDIWADTANEDPA